MFEFSYALVVVPWGDNHEHISIRQSASLVELLYSIKFSTRSQLAFDLKVQLCHGRYILYVLPCILPLYRLI
jgi:hypothetical protein